MTIWISNKNSTQKFKDTKLLKLAQNHQKPKTSFKEFYSLNLDVAYIQNKIACISMANCRLYALV